MTPSKKKREEAPAEAGNEAERDDAAAPGPDAGEGAGETTAAAATVPAEELDAVKRERDEFLDLAKRARADYANLVRRSEDQRKAARLEAESRMALDMISVLDDLERALVHAKEATDAEAIIDGISLVRDKFLATLARYGVKPIEAEGAQFDHNLHHAVAEQKTDEVPAGTVVSVTQTGYTAADRLLRPALVVVARPAEEEAAESGSCEGGDIGS